VIALKVASFHRRTSSAKSGKLQCQICQNAKHHLAAAAIIAGCEKQSRNASRSLLAAQFHQMETSSLGPHRRNDNFQRRLYFQLAFASMHIRVRVCVIVLKRRVATDTLTSCDERRAPPPAISVPLPKLIFTEVRAHHRTTSVRSHTLSCA
jgi:hypothetical protein